MTERITFEAGKLGGKACIRGLRISVSHVLGMLATMTQEEIFDNYPYLEPEDFRACLEYASRRLDGEEVYPIGA